RQPARPQTSQLVKHRGIVQDATVKGGGVDLVEANVRSEQVAALDDLTAKRLERQVLDLVHGRVDAPICRIGIAPLRSHAHIYRPEPPARQPPGQKRLRPPVGSRALEVT